MERKASEREEKPKVVKEEGQEREEEGDPF